MSEEQLKAFIAKVQADTSLQEQLKAQNADVIAIAKAAGFVIQTSEVLDGAQANRANLTENELESIAGGAAVRGARTSSTLGLICTTIIMTIEHIC